MKPSRSGSGRIGRVQGAGRIFWWSFVLGFVLVLLNTPFLLGGVPPAHAILSLLTVPGTILTLPFQNSVPGGAWGVIALIAISNGLAYGVVARVVGRVRNRQLVVWSLALTLTLAVAVPGTLRAQTRLSLGAGANIQTIVGDDVTGPDYRSGSAAGASAITPLSDIQRARDRRGNLATLIAEFLEIPAVRDELA